MPAFRYRALARTGEARSGELEAADAGEAIARVRELGYLPIEAAPASGGRLSSGSLRLWAARRPPSTRELTLFTQQFAALVGAGLSVERALDTVARGAGERGMGPVIAEILKRVRGGAPLSGALADHQTVFPRFYWTTLRAAEQGGFLPSALERLAAFLMNSQTLRDSVRGALVYPTLLLVMAAGSVIVILTLVLPQFREIFSESGVALSWFTAGLMAVSGIFEAYLPLILAGAAAFALGLRRIMRAAAFRAWREDAAMRLPILGALIVQFEIARFSRSLGLLVDNGVPLASALALAGAVVQSRRVSAAVTRAISAVKEGQRLAAALTGSVFPSSVIELVRVGEETGRLGRLLEQTADLLDGDVRRALDRAMALLVPVLTVVLGLIIAAIVISIYTTLIGIDDLVA